MPDHDLDDDLLDEDADAPEDLDEDDLDELDEDDDEDLDVDGDDEVDADAEEAGVPVEDRAPLKPAVEDDDEEEGDDEDDDVEASLDVILKERMVVNDDEDDDDDDETPDGDERGARPLKVLPKQPGEFVCQSCFLVKHPSQLADRDRMFCRDCV